MKHETPLKTHATSQPSDMVERVARVIYAHVYPDGDWIAKSRVQTDSYRELARSALETSHHAELVAALAKLANENSSFVVGPNARRFARAVLAKIGGDA